MGNNDDHLITPQLSLPVAKNMQMKIWDIVESASYPNDYSVLVSTTGSSVADFTDTLASYSVTNTSWTERTVDLSAYAGMNIYISFWQSYSAASYYGFGLDDFTVEEIPSCLSPDTLTTTNITATTADINWTDPNSATEWEIEYDTTGFSPGTGNVVHITSTPPYNLSGLSSNTVYDWYVRSICGVGDTSAWSSVSTFTTPCLSISSFPYTEDFETVQLGEMPSCWTNSLVSGSDNWETFDASGFNDIDSAHAGSQYLEKNYSSSSAIATSPAFDLTAMGGNSRVRVWLHRFDVADQNDQYMVLINDGDSINGADTLFTLNSITTAPPAVSSSGWYEYTINIPASYNTVSTAHIMFRGVTSAGFSSYDLGIDNFVLEAAPPCIEPTQLSSADNLSSLGTSVALSWTEGNSATEWEIEYGVTGFTQGSGTVVNTTSNPDTLTGLSPQTTYDWYVRSVCSSSDTSGWSLMGSFTTPCIGVSATFVESFDGVATPNLPNCWATITPSSSTIQTVTSTDHGVPIPSGPNALEINDAATDLLISPPISDLSSGLNRLRMQIAFEGGGTAFSDTLFVGVTNSQTNAAAFVPLDTITMENTNGGFEEYSFHFDNPTLVGSNNFIAFSYKTAGGGYEYFIDDFIYEPIPSCIVPSNLNVSNITNSSANINWVEQNSATEWEIEYGTEGFTQGTGTTVIVNTKPHSLSGLTAYSTYDYYVRSVCAVGDTSRWSPKAYTFTVGLPLAGLYSIDSAQVTGGANFQSFSDFGNIINLVGVSGPVQVNVAPGVYYDQLSLYDIEGSSAANPISINGQNSGQVTLSHDQSLRNSTITLERVNNIEVKNLTIEATGGSDSWGIHILDSSHHLSIDSNRVIMPVGTTIDVVGIMISNSETLDNSSGDNGYYISITNNHITGGERGISTYGGGSTSRNRALLIEGNEIYDADDNGIYVYGYDSVAVRSNHVDNLNNSGSDALYLAESENFEVSGNYLRGQDNGIDTDDLNFDNTVTQNSWIFNNMFIGDDDGAYFDDSEYISFYHNSFKGEDYGIYANDHLSWDVRNNIFYGNTDYAFYSPDSLAITMDYNLYYTGGTDLIRFGGTSNIYTDLAALQSGMPSLNANSLEGDPLFFGATDLHVYGTLANDAGDNSVGITTDFDGDVRPLAPSTTVDIGADEFTPASCYPPSALNLTVNSATSIDFDWTESGSATEWEISYDTTGHSLGTGLNTVVTSKPATISNLMGNSTYDFYVRAICGSADSSTWIGPITITTPCVTQAPYIEDFESSMSQIPNCMEQGAGNSEDWEFTNTASGNHIGNNGTLSGSTNSNGYFAYVDDSSPHNSGTELYTPYIDVSSLTTPRLTFFLISDNEGDSNGNTDFHVDVWDGAQWNDSLFFSDTNSLNAAWEQIVVDLSTLTITGEIRIRFVVDEENGTGFDDDRAIDDIVVEETPTCFMPTNLAYSPTSTTSADLSWTSATSAPNAIVEYGSVGFTLGTGTQIVSTSTTESITGLSTNLAYEAYVKDSCAVGDASVWAGPITFGGEVVPCDNFDSYNTGNAASQSILINGWGGTVAGGGDAEFSTDYASSGTQSLKIYDSGPNAGSDVVAELDTYNSGMWNVAVDVYVPATYGGYYNILHNYTPASQVWAIEVTLDANGTATVVEGTNGSNTIGTYTYNTGAWNTIEHIIDLDNDTAYIRVNGVNTNVGWQFSLGSTNFGDQFNAMNFYSTAPTGQTPLVYFDNFCVTEVLPHYPIGIINTEDANGDADSVNVECSISGTVVGYDRRGTNEYEFALIDLSTGVQEGITVFEFNDVSGYSNPTEGDSLLIFGSVDQFRGLTQFRPDSIVVLGTGTVPMPDTATTLDETTESKLILLNDWILLDPSQGTGSYNLRAVDAATGNDTIIVRIDSDSEISDSLAVVGNGWVIGDTLCSLVGVGGQFDGFSSPFLDGYQVFPSLYADVTVCRLSTGIKNVAAKAKSINIYPNPTVGQFTVKSSGLNNDNALVTVRDISGRIVLQDNIAQSNSPFTKQYDLSGKAKGLYFISIIDGEERINQKLIVQ